VNARVVVRVLLGFMAVASLEIGVWATLAPRSFYDDYPGVFGREWVRADGPFNEHLIRDFGALNLGLALLTLAAFIGLAALVVRITAVVWLAWGVPHLVYHLRHLDVYDGSDAVAVVVSLAILPVFAVLLFVLAPRAAQATAPR
jgi:hypothetical protein